MGTTQCDFCGKQFEKPDSEIKRNKKLNRKNFCSRSCCGRGNIKKNLGEFYGIGNVQNLNQGNKIDEFTGLRDFIRRSKNRFKRGANNFDSSITKEELLEIWNKQKGICPYTGIVLEKPKSKGGNSKIYTASLDRIDSEIGYHKDNVQFISTAINLMKNTMSHDDTIKLCKIIANNWNNIGLDSTPPTSCLTLE